jgi:Acyl-CoA reductase (LuxC)
MTDGHARVRALVAAAARIADPSDDLGRRARRELVLSTGLSSENVEWALVHALETAPTSAELDALCGSVTAAPAVHVVLPANVFVAAHRALALALAASERVSVRPSRREPGFARLLGEAAPGLFELVSEIAPERGDHVWAYGGDRSLTAVRAGLPGGVVLHAQGPGFGLALLDADAVTAEAATALAEDVTAFDQRGCLSPRAAVVLGSPADANECAALVATALGERAREIPLGRLDASELADITRFRAAAVYAGTLLPAGPGGVLVTARVEFELAPTGRHLTVAAAPSLAAMVGALDPTRITAVGVAGPTDLTRAVEVALPSARVSPLGRMQRPAFDGPADRRPSRA